MTTQEGSRLSKNVVPLLKSEASSTLLQTKPSRDQIDRARTATKRILGAYPDYGKSSPEYGVALLEAMSHLTEEELSHVMNPRSGILTRSRFLPTVADIHDLLREREQRRRQFQPAPTSWKKFDNDLDAPWSKEADFETRKNVVVKQLGYNPDDRIRAGQGPLVEPTNEGVGAVKLTHPAAPVSDRLKTLLVKQGFLTKTEAFASRDNE